MKTFKHILNEVMTSAEKFDSNSSHKILDQLEKTMRKMKAIKKGVASETREVWHKNFVNKIQGIINELNSLY